MQPFSRFNFELVYAFFHFWYALSVEIIMAYCKIIYFWRYGSRCDKNAARHWPRHGAFVLTQNLPPRAKKLYHLMPIKIFPRALFHDGYHYLSAASSSRLLRASLQKRYLEWPLSDRVGELLYSALPSLRMPSSHILTFSWFRRCAITFLFLILHAKNAPLQGTSLINYRRATGGRADDFDEHWGIWI